MLLSILFLLLPALLLLRWDPIGDLDEALGSPLGISNAKKARKANEKNLKAIRGLYNAAQGQYSQDTSAALQRQKVVTAGLEKSKRTGLLNLAGQGSAARQGVLDRAQTSLDTATSMQEDRGVMSVALAGALKRSSNYDVNTALSSIDEAISRLAADFELQAEGAVASSGSRESMILGQRAEGRKGLTQGYMDILGGVQHVPAPGWLGDAAKLVAAF